MIQYNSQGEDARLERGDGRGHERLGVVAEVVGSVGLQLHWGAQEEHLGVGEHSFAFVCIWAEEGRGDGLQSAHDVEDGVAATGARVGAGAFGLEPRPTLP